MRSERCRVVVKLRPTLRSEFEALDDGIHVPAPGKVVLGKEFEVDHVYHPSDGDAVYEDEVQGLVKSLYEGINATVFAYGASGSGKTHTVLGSKQTPGLVDRITDEVFARYDQRTCTVSVSVEELYCERFTDLLAASAYPPASTTSSSSSSSQHSGARSGHFRHPLQHRQAAVSKYNWQKVTLTNSEEMKTVVQHVLRKRHTASTCLNDKSSRSHVIVTITLEQRKAIIEHKYAEDDELPCSSASSMTSASTATGAGSSMLAVGAGSLSNLSSLRQQDASDARSVQDDAASEGSAAPVDTYLIGKLYLVDLAGSENIKRSGAEGARQKEAGEINKSLCHLKTVIEEVFKGGRVSTYRNSKLTFRLQDALGGGNSKLLVVACISTARQDLAETKETLRFAEMARAITNTPVVNREPKDELIHRLQLQVAELQDQLKTARQEGGRAAAEEVLTQLNAVEAALADLQEEKEVQEAAWKAEEAKMTDAFVKVKEEVSELHTMLTSAQAHEASLAQSLAAERSALQQERSALQQVRQQLAAEQGSLQATLQTGAATADLLLDMRDDVSMLQQCCGALQQQVTGQQAAAAAAVKLCTEQQQQAHVVQQQLSAQDTELQQLRRQLQQERTARAAAELHVSQLLQQQEATRLAAQRCAVEAQQGMQQMALLCTTLQEQASAAASQRQLALQQHQSVLSSLQAAEAAQEAAKAEINRLQQQLGTLQQEHAHELNVTAASTARAAAAAAAQHLQQCREHEQQLQAAQATIKQLQGQLDDEKTQHAAMLLAEQQKHEQQLQAAQATITQLQGQLDDEQTEHAAMLLAEQQKHKKQLADNMHSSVKKLMDDRLRCKEHMRMPLSSLLAEARVLSDALASPTPYMIEGEASSRPASPTSSSKRSSRSSSPAEVGAAASSLQDTEAAPTAVRSSKRVSPVPQLKLGASEAMFSNTTAAPMQDASERHLSELYTGSDGYSSGVASPGDVAPLHAEQKTAALVAVAAAAAAMTAARLTPRRASVHVHAEGCSHGGYSDSILSYVDSFVTSDGRGSPVDRVMLPACGSLGASPSIASLGSIASIDNSQHAPVHPAATAAATAAAAAVAAGMRSSQEQQRRHRRRRREFTQSFAAGSWPISYTSKGEVDEEAAAAAFSQLRSGELNVSNLQHFLEHRMLGNKLHSRTLVDGRRKRKHELIQDMLAYHQYYLATRSAAGSLSNPSSSNGVSSCGADVASEAAESPTAPSQCSSPGSVEVWHPLSMPRPSSAAPSSATCSPAKLDFARYSVDAAVTTAAAAAGRSSGGGSSSRPGQLKAQALGSVAFAVEAADANSSRQQPDRSASEQQQQQQGRWSWLTPRRRKQQSILAQLQASGKHPSGSSYQQGQGMLWSPEPHVSTARYHHGSAAQQQQQPELTVQMPQYVSEGGCDAVSPRDKRHTAAAGKASGTGSNPSTRSTTPAGIRLSGKTISAVTGSAVAEFYVDSPAVKLGRRAASKHLGGGGDNPVQLSVDLGSAHRSSWRKAQLLRPN